MTKTSSPELLRYNRLLLLVAGLGGLLYGIDVGIIGGALPYLEATSGLSGSELSIIVAAVLLGSVFSTLFAGMLADWMGRKPLMLISGLLFAFSIPVIALSHTFTALFLGRLLQGLSGGVVGVVIPLYLAECLPAETRGRGTGIFQFLLTFGIFAAALIGIYFSVHLSHAAETASPGTLFALKDHAWRSIFWVSLPPGLLFVAGALFVSESPRWLFRRGREAQALKALERSRTPEQAAIEFEEMRFTPGAAAATPSLQTRDSLFQRRYIAPFLLACAILFCNTATGINSVIGYNTDILLQSGLRDVTAHWGYVLFTLTNFLATIIAMRLVDRRGRRILLQIGTSGIVLSLVVVALLFRATESRRVDVAAAVVARQHNNVVPPLHFNGAMAGGLLAAQGLHPSNVDQPYAFSVLYSCGGYSSSTSSVRSDDPAAAPVEIAASSCLPGGRVEAFFRNPLVNFDRARSAPIIIEHAYLSPVPDASHGWMVALALYAFVAFYAMGPGVCVWLALSELMPTRIRSNGMSIALVINQLVSTTLAAIFLPVVGAYGYATMFFVFVGFTVIYFLTVTFFLPETRGKTLEEIEANFVGAQPAA